MAVILDDLTLRARSAIDDEAEICLDVASAANTTFEAARHASRFESAVMRALAESHRMYGHLLPAVSD